MVKIAVCEDELELLIQLTSYVKTILEKHSISHHIESFTSTCALFAREAFDILLLDIEMPPLSGLETAKRLRRRGDKSSIIFITAHPRYAIEAYDVQAFHYLIKPVDLHKLEVLLIKLCSSLQEAYTQAIAIRQGTRIWRIPFEKILYLEVIDRKIYLHTLEETISFYGKMEALELPKVFFRCHRSYIVNLQHVKQYDKGEITLDSKESIPLSKRRYPSFGLAFMEYIKESGDIF